MTTKYYEYEIRKRIQKNGNISVTKCARELGIDVDTVLEILSKIEKHETINVVDTPKSNPLEQTKENTFDEVKDVVAIPVEQAKDFTINELIKGGESSTLEFKASMLMPTQSDPAIVYIESMIEKAKTEGEKANFEKGLKEKQSLLKDDMSFTIVKTIAAFLNSEGGILLIGVKDDGTIFGIENDFSYLGEKRNIDGWLLYLDELINKQIGTEFLQFIKVDHIPYENKTIAKIVVAKSSRPAYVEKKDAEFYIRSLNSSRALKMREANHYILDHWKKF